MRRRGNLHAHLCPSLGRDIQTARTAEGTLTLPWVRHSGGYGVNGTQE